MEKRCLIRLDDASVHMDISKWSRMENLLDEYNVKPIVGIIPNNQDDSLIKQYDFNPDFWNMVQTWIDKGWIPAMHGYEHRYVTTDGGVNPINKKSEFAGLPYEEQAEKIRMGWEILVKHKIRAEIFFAPAHTFDMETLNAIKNKTPIRVISDTIAWDIYKKEDFWFIPQQSGSVRSLPFKIITYCYHPNTMNQEAFNNLSNFMERNRNLFLPLNINEVYKIRRKEKMIDRFLKSAYFIRRK